MMGKKYRNVTLFLLITFLLPLLSILMQSIISNTTIKFILYGLEAASPTIAAITVLIIDKSVKKFLKDMFHAKYLLMSLVLPIMITCSTMFLAKQIFCFLFNVNFTLGKISFVQFIIILWALVAEELGWRGYLEPFLRGRVVFKWLVPFLVGTVWCLWHYNFFLLDGIQVPILLFFISCIIESYIYSYLMEYTNNNLVSAMIYHFTWNLFIHIFAINPIDNKGSTSAYMILVVLEALVLIIFLVKKKNKA